MKIEGQKGYGIIEIIIVTGIGTILLFSINNFLNMSFRLAINDNHKIEALSLAKSSLEQARAVRDEDQTSPSSDPKLGWNNITALTLDSPYHFEASGSKWIAVAGSATVERYTVWATVSQVERNSAGKGDIVSVGGVVDPNTIKITSYVSWPSSSGPQQISLIEYLTNFK